MAYLRVLHHAEAAPNELGCEVDNRALEQGHGHRIHVYIGWLYLRVRKMTSSKPHTTSVSDQKTEWKVR